MVLWEGYPREQSSWIAEEDITCAAIRYGFCKKKNIVCQYYSIQRSFITPTPNERVVLDSISSFLDGVTRSLRVGTVRNTKFTVEFRTDIFRLLFGGKGERANNGRGNLYQLTDFDSKYFSPGWHQCWDRLGDGCEVNFPIQLYSTIKYSPLCYSLDSNGCVVPKSRYYNEVVSVFMLKNRC